jgi:hypothetical protein
VPCVATNRSRNPREPENHPASSTSPCAATRSTASALPAPIRERRSSVTHLPVKRSELPCPSHVPADDASIVAMRWRGVPCKTTGFLTGLGRTGGRTGVRVKSASADSRKQLTLAAIPATTSNGYWLLASGRWVIGSESVGGYVDLPAHSPLATYDSQLPFVHDVAFSDRVVDLDRGQVVGIDGE